MSELSEADIKELERKEKRRIYDKKYYEENRDRIKEAARKKYKRNPNYWKTDRCKEYQKDYRSQPENRLIAKAQQKAWREKHPDYWKTGKVKSRMEDRNKYLEGLQTPCVKCGAYHPGFMDWHHRDPSTKEGSISKMKHGSLKKLHRELEKCDCLCSNCHRIHHYNLHQAEKATNH